MLSKAPRYRRGILAHAQAVDTRPTSLSEVGSVAWDRGYQAICSESWDAIYQLVVNQRTISTILKIEAVILCACVP